MLQYGGFGEAQGLVFWLIVAGNGQSGGPGKSCLRSFRVFRSSSVTVPGPEPTDRKALTRPCHCAPPAHPALTTAKVVPAALAPNRVKRCAIRPGVAGLTIKESFYMSQVGAWDFAGEKLHALQQRAATGRADAGKSSRTLAPLYVAAGGRWVVWRWGQ